MRRPEVYASNIKQNGAGRPYVMRTRTRARMRVVDCRVLELDMFGAPGKMIGGGSSTWPTTLTESLLPPASSPHL